MAVIKANPITTLGDPRKVTVNLAWDGTKPVSVTEPSVRNVRGTPTQMPGGTEYFIKNRKFTLKDGFEMSVSVWRPSPKDGNKAIAGGGDAQVIEA